MTITSSLSRHLPKAPTTEEELNALATAVWKYKGKVLIDPEQIFNNDWFKQSVINYAVGKHGDRNK
jgi:hypothetical protein